MQCRFSVTRFVDSLCSLGLILLAFASAQLRAPLAADEPATTEPATAGLVAEYESRIRPLISEYCLACHATDVQEGHLDLERFTSADQVRNDLASWQKVVEMLEAGTMPPEDEPQPGDMQRQRLIRWARSFITAAILDSAGDPGHVVLRRLSNFEYDNTIRDLTGVDLRPSREFPPDAAAGEGFTNTGQSLVMSPGLLNKYLGAAKEIAAHAVLLGEGMRFSPDSTRREWTAGIVAQIEGFYGRFAPGNSLGRVPLEPYVAATLRHRNALSEGTISFDDVAAAGKINARYLETVWTALNRTDPSLPLDPIRARWREAGPDEAEPIAREIDTWRERLWKLSERLYFESTDHGYRIGNWQLPVDPLVAEQRFQSAIEVTPEKSDLVIYLAALDAGDGNQGDYVVWQRPRFEHKEDKERPPLLLRDVRLRADRPRLDHLIRLKLAGAADCLAAIVELEQKKQESTLKQLATTRGLDEILLRRWAEYTGVGMERPDEITRELNENKYLREKMINVRGHMGVAGWGKQTTPAVIANASDTEIKFPDSDIVAPAHSIIVRPGVYAGLSNKETPSMQAVIGWQSPTDCDIQIRGKLTDVERGPDNGVAWDVEFRQPGETRSLDSGVLNPQDKSERSVQFATEKLSVRRGDLLSLVIDPIDSDDRYDTTQIELAITEQGGEQRTWDLATDVASSIHAGNPHADSHDNRAVWHFYGRPTHQKKLAQPVIPAGSVLAQWKQARADPARHEELGGLADRVQQVLTSSAVPSQEANAALRHELTSLEGPLLRGLNLNSLLKDVAGDAATAESDFGLDPALFGSHPQGHKIDDASLVVRAPSVLKIRLPTELVADHEFRVTGTLDPVTGQAGSVQLSLAKPDRLTGFIPRDPILTRSDSATHQRLSKMYVEFRRWFPLAICRPQLRTELAVLPPPDDVVLPMVLSYREDEHLCRLMLNEEETRRIDALWTELRFVSQEALRLGDDFDLLLQYASQNGQSCMDKVRPRGAPIRQWGQALKQSLAASEPQHVQAVLQLARRGFRRPLMEEEEEELRGMYRRLRDAEELSHDEAIRVLLTRVLISPSFLYRIERPAPGNEARRVSDWELATRLSYFLWASMPDEELTTAVLENGLTGSSRPAAQNQHDVAPVNGSNEDVAELLLQTRRMLQDARIRRLAIQFACQWLHIRDFDRLEKSEQHFPAFAELRPAMYEESVLFFTDLFQNDRSVLSILAADHTFLNEALAKHYGIPWTTPDANGAPAIDTEFRRIDGVGKFSRGGLLAHASILAKQSGASRTSPILRGNWVYETLLGKKLPQPPANVPQLPETVPQGLTERQLIAQHSSVPECAKCHVRIDSFGFALENFDGIGRFRQKDKAGQEIDSRTTLEDGAEIDGLDGLREYLLSQQKQQFVRTFCRKLLGYALGRSVSLSDKPLLDTILRELEANDYRVSSAVLAIVSSEQFQQHRGMDVARKSK